MQPWEPMQRLMEAEHMEYTGNDAPITQIHPNMTIDGESPRKQVVVNMIFDLVNRQWIQYKDQTVSNMTHWQSPC
jgi:hypothetical protein